MFQQNVTSHHVTLYTHTKHTNVILFGINRLDYYLNLSLYIIESLEQLVPDWLPQRS